MKVLVISAEYPPFFSGGIALNVFDLNQHMNKKNDIITVTFGENNKTILSQREETKLISVPIPKMGEELCYEEKYCIQNDIILNEIKDYERELAGIELVVLHGYFLSRVALYLTKKYDIPLLYYLHVIYTSQYNEKLDQISLDELEVLNKSSAIICVSQYLLDEACKVCTILDKTVVIGKPIELEVHKDQNEYVNENYYLYVGRMSEEKGIEILLEAFKKYLAKNENAVLYCIGTFVEEKYKRTIKEICGKTNKLQQHVIFLGGKDRTEIYQYMRRSNAVIIPSYMETFGKVAIEAMANKSLVIAADVGGLGSLIVDDKTGLKFKTGDVDDLYFQLCKLATINRDSIIDAAYKFVNKEFSYEKIKWKSNQFINKQLNIENFYE